MTTPADLRKFATDCLLWAEEAKDASQRDTLIRLARMWMQTASELDHRVTMPGGPPPGLFDELQAKLN